MLNNTTREGQINTDYHPHCLKLVTRFSLKLGSSKLPDHQRNFLRRTWDLMRLLAPPVPILSRSDYLPSFKQSTWYSTFPNLNQQYRTHFPTIFNPHPHQ